MKRLCVFAHYDKDNLIDDYVIYYLQALRKICKYLIFVSDCNLPEPEILKLSGLADYVLATKHGEYDFGSYKRGFLLSLDENLDYNQLIFANDSCYGPFYPLDEIFSKMDKKNIDYWGMTQNSYGVTKNPEDRYKICPWMPHLQSYFLVFNSNVFKSEVFNHFIQKISKLELKTQIITEYEIGLSKLLKKAGFKRGVYINKFKYENNCSGGRKWDILIKKYKHPFLKTSIIKNGFYYTGEVKGYEEVIEKYTNYPLEFIKSNAERLKNLYENQYATANLYRKIRYHILNCFPQEVRLVVIYIEKFSYIILNAICFNKLKKF